MKCLDRFLSTSKISEVLVDYKGQVSFGRTGAFICLLFSQAMSVSGFFYAHDPKMLAYCSTIALQFLGAAISLYIPSKATETFSKKWAPEISSTLVKMEPFVAPSQQQPPQQEESGGGKAI